MMSGTAPGRVTRRWPCKGCRIEIGQTYLAKTQEHDSDWFPHYCRECEVNIRVEELAAEELAEQLEEIAAEAQKRFAAPEIEQRIREGAAADFEEEPPRGGGPVL